MALGFLLCWGGLFVGLGAFAGGVFASRAIRIQMKRQTDAVLTAIGGLRHDLAVARALGPSSAGPLVLDVPPSLRAALEARAQKECLHPLAVAKIALQHGLERFSEEAPWAAFDPLSAIGAPAENGRESEAMPTRVFAPDEERETLEMPSPLPPLRVPPPSINGLRLTPTRLSVGTAKERSERTK